VSQVIRRQLALETILAQRVGRHHDAGIVDQQVQALVALAEAGGEFAYRFQAAQVQRQALDAGPRVFLQDLLAGCHRFVRVAAGQDHAAALACQCLGGLQAQTDVGAGNDGDTAVLVACLCECPVHG